MPRVFRSVFVFICVSNVNTIQRRALLYGLATCEVLCGVCEDCYCESYP